ncbi:MAG: alkaline phosphatase [Brevinema sp.]
MRFLSLTIMLILFGGCSNGQFSTSSGTTELVKAKNAIILIADGQSVGVTTLLRWYKDGEPLAMDSMASGLVKTHNADTPIADSAPAGTALATGHKSRTGFIGVLPDESLLPGSTKNGEARRPVASILKAARLDGKSTGIIATSEVMHATPAAYTSHSPSRRNYDDLSEQQVYQNLDIIMGGGYYYFTPEGRNDGKDLVQTFLEKGYTLVRTKEEMDNANTSKIWGAFADTAMDYHFDRPSTQPSLAEMTDKAIKVLSKNSKGFFLMVEGSKVDWAAHANDPIGMLSDAYAFDEAVKVALEFAKKDKNTIVIALTDHGNSGITMGDRSTSVGYDLLPIETFITPLKNATLTAEGIIKLISQGVATNVAIKTGYGIDPTPAELASLQGSTYLESSIAQIISTKAKIGFTTGGHTGEEVPLYSYLPGDKRITGVLDNTDIPKYVAAAMNLDLDKTSARLFISADELRREGITVEEKENQLILTKNKSLTLEKNKNIALQDNKIIELEGVAVYNGITWYVPTQVKNFL